MCRYLKCYFTYAISIYTYFYIILDFVLVRLCQLTSQKQICILMLICLISEDEAIMIPTRSGKKFLLMINGYTYSQINYSAHWLCSSKALGCPARIKKATNGEIVKVNTKHTHPPPKYIVQNGNYFKI